MPGAAARLVAGLLALPLGVAAQGLPPPLDGQGGLSPRWRVGGLPQQKAPLSRFTAVSVDGRPVLQIDADRSYGNFVFDANGQPPPRSIAWSWRVLLPNPGADLRQKSGDDTPARVCLSFDLPLERVPFMERQLLRMARSRAGEALPAATLCWVWGTQEARDSLMDNAFSRRVRYLVLRGQADGVGRWVDERRDVAADFRRAFGDESSELPPLAAVVVGADADNTGARTRAQVTGLSFEP